MRDRCSVGCRIIDAKDKKSFISSRSGLVVKFVLAMHEPRVRFTAATFVLSFCWSIDLNRSSFGCRYICRSLVFCCDRFELISATDEGCGDQKRKFLYKEASKREE
jgi:hypothetical protein